MTTSTSTRCGTCFTSGIGDPASCDHGASQVLDQLARYDTDRTVAASDVARLSGVPMSVISQVLFGDGFRGTYGTLLVDGLVERIRTGGGWQYRLTAAGRALVDGEAPQEPEHDEAYLLFCEEQEAIHDGRATELDHCYLCEPDVNLRTARDAGPLRGIARRRSTGGPDPYEARTMVPCGHVLI